MPAQGLGNGIIGPANNNLISIGGEALWSVNKPNNASINVTATIAR